MASGRHEGPPVGSAAREATAPPYHGHHRAPEPEPLSGMALMNIAGADNEGLEALRNFFAAAADHGTEDGKRRAPLYLEAIDAELTSRRAERLTDERWSDSEDGE